MMTPHEYAEKLVSLGYTRADVLNAWKEDKLPTSTDYILAVLDAWEDADA